MVLVWVGCCGVLGVALLIMAGGWINLGAANVTPPPLPQASVHQGHAQPTTKAERTSGPARRADSADDVLAKTQFVQKYKHDLPEITHGHTDKGLATHGVDLCRRIADPHETITDMVYVFMNEYHNHPGPVTADAAKHTISLALQEICPNLLPQWKAKPAL